MSVVDFSRIRLYCNYFLLCLDIHRKWQVWYVKFQNEFLSGKLELPGQVDLPRHQFSEHTREDKVMLLRKCLYGLHDTARMYFILFNETVEAAGLTPFKTAPCVWKRMGMLFACHVDDVYKFFQKNAGHWKPATPAQAKMSVEGLGKTNIFFKQRSKLFTVRKSGNMANKSVEEAP